MHFPKTLQGCRKAGEARSARFNGDMTKDNNNDNLNNSVCSRRQAGPIADLGVAMIHAKKRDEKAERLLGRSH